MKNNTEKEGKINKWECYIEEYKSENGLSARLRDKETNKKISIQINSSGERAHFLQFISQAKLNKGVMPTVFEPDGDDIVAVYGIEQKEDNETIFVDINRDGGGYLFE